MCELVSSLVCDIGFVHISYLLLFAWCCGQLNLTFSFSFLSSKYLYSAKVY